MQRPFSPEAKEKKIKKNHAINTLQLFSRAFIARDRFLSRQDSKFSFTIASPQKPPPSVIIAFSRTRWRRIMCQWQQLLCLLAVSWCASFNNGATPKDRLVLVFEFPNFSKPVIPYSAVSFELFATLSLRKRWKKSSCQPGNKAFKKLSEEKDRWQERRQCSMRTDPRHHGTNRTLLGETGDKWKLKSSELLPCFAGSYIQPPVRSKARLGKCKSSGRKSSAVPFWGVCDLKTSKTRPEHSGATFRTVVQDISGLISNIRTRSKGVFETTATTA